MRIPHTVNENAVLVYKVLPQFFNRENEQIKSDDFIWDASFLPSLKDMCIYAIAGNWEKRPLYDELVILPNKLHVLELLSPTLPLELTVPIIEEDIYWKNTYFARWPEAPSPNRVIPCQKDDAEVDEIPEDSDYEILNTSKTNIFYIKEEVVKLKLKTWKQCFMEKYMETELERMKPDMFNPEYIKELTDLCGEYIISLNLTQLQANVDAECVDHISLHSLLAHLPNLVEFTVCFSQANMEDKFSWKATKVSTNDCAVLGNGIAKSNMKILRVLRSNIDCYKLKHLLRPLTTHRYLKKVDISHCIISDEGARAIGGLLEANYSIETLVLINNKIGPRGAQGLAYYLCQDDCRLIELNLKLNPLGVEGGKYIATALARGAKSLTSLSLAVCALTAENLHIGSAIGLNNTLKRLDLSNNHLGEETAECLLKSLTKNGTLCFIDLRMCDMPPRMAEDIYAKVRRNFKGYEDEEEDDDMIFDDEWMEESLIDEEIKRKKSVLDQHDDDDDDDDY